MVNGQHTMDDGQCVDNMWQTTCGGQHNMQWTRRHVADKVTCNGRSTANSEAANRPADETTRGGERTMGEAWQTRRQTMDEAEQMTDEAWRVMGDGWRTRRQAAEVARRTMGEARRARRGG